MAAVNCSASVWGTDHGVGTRSAYGVSDLPAGVAVEIEGILKVRS